MTSLHESKQNPREKYPPKLWHKIEHRAARLNMIQLIIDLLILRDKSNNTEWRNKIPSVSERIEDAIYHEAFCFHDYTDISTLKLKLQQLALRMMQQHDEVGECLAILYEIFENEANELHENMLLAEEQNTLLAENMLFTEDNNI